MTTWNKTARFTSAMLTVAMRSCALALIVVGTDSIANAGGGLPTPEIDPSSLASALTLLTGGALLVADRLRSKSVSAE